MNTIKRNALFSSVVAALAMASINVQAALPAYVNAAITDSQTQLTDLVAVMVTAAVALTLLSLTPRVLIKMIRGLGSKVSF